MKHERYLAPFDDELMQMGYIPLWVSREAQLELHRALTIIGSRYAVQADWFLQFYGNMLEPSRTVVGVMAYVLDYPQQFGGDVHLGMFNALIRVLRRVNWRWIKLSGKCRDPYRPKIDRKFVETVIGIMIDAFEKEARDMCRRVAGEEVAYPSYKPKRPARKKRLYIGHGKDRSYRIERLADKYE